MHFHLPTHFYLPFFSKLKINREYKSKLFCRAFADKKYALQLYNAVNGSDYQNEEDLIFTTLEDALYVGMKDDLSFVLGTNINLYEHQSTYNPNMPLRGVFYLSTLLRNYVQEHHLDIYSSKRLVLPVPQFVVFYNGEADAPDRTELLLSDSFPGNSTPALECRAIMLNINYGQNQELMKKCSRLEEYSYVIASIREYMDKGFSQTHAVNLAVEKCIENGKLTDILSKNKQEVIAMLETDYDMRKYKKLIQYNARKDGLEEGRSIGIALGRAEGLTEGRAEGQIETARQCARNLFQNDVSMELVSACIPLLSSAELEQIYYEVIHNV